ncbi:hypothetical protein [Caulobacter mirabilis]|uniref:DUF1131 domain-containing protein n=1 Tax=Caulobacter mirabilis TaxID=69666 RepID=A0A2D2ASV6_9CAUL|nr:hypothetical protein [Caulobacter mirabilis]ATQ41057.1 hypothetical protein CSW64_00860 [Caulobacter mirabilis]
MKMPFVLAAAAVALAACGEASEPASAPAPKPAAPAAPALTAAGPFQATKTGVGAVTDQTRFDMGALEKAFPGARAETTFLVTPDNMVAVLSLSGENGLIVDVVEKNMLNRVGLINVLGGPVVGPGGEKIGALRSETSFTDAQCEAGKGQNYMTRTLCRRADDPNTTYVFKGKGPSAKIVAIRWLAPGEALPDASLAPVYNDGRKVR